MITSNTNPKIQSVRALLKKKQTREEQKAFVIEGVRLVEDAQLTGQIPQTVFFSSQLSERGNALVDSFRKQNVDCEEVSHSVINSLADTETSQGILVVLPLPKFAFPKNPDFLVIVDVLRDPGNLGTILRSCASAGVQGVITTPGTADAFAPKVVRSGMGAHFRLPIVESSWQEIDHLFHHKTHPALKILASTGNSGIPIWKVDFTQPIALIVGGEAEGISPEGEAIADKMITIPMPGNTESLNAAVAAGILLFEVVRQRSK